MSILRRLLRRDPCTTCGHSRDDHFVPYAAGHPCSLCTCEAYR